MNYKLLVKWGSFLCFQFILIQLSFSQVTICSWNLKDLGKSKSNYELNFIAEIISDYDIIAIQEVVTGNDGAHAIARLLDILNRKGNKWDYSISDPSTGSTYKTERYAFIWKPSKLAKVGDAWLEKQYRLEIDREPYFATFKTGGKTFTLVNFHAITKSRQPETEIKYLKYLPSEYPTLNLIFCGDFNCPQSHSVFNPLKALGYKPILINQKTSLKQTCINNNCLASEYDNIFFNELKITLIESGVIHFYKYLESLDNARLISDHIPLYFKFIINEF